MAKYRIKSIGATFVPQKRVLWWWKDMATPQLTQDDAERLIHQHKHRGQKPSESRRPN